MLVLFGDGHRWTVMKPVLNVFREFNEIHFRNSRFRSKHDPVRFYATDRGVLYILPLINLKSSASASDADRTAKTASIVAQFFTPGAFCLFRPPHGNEKV